MLRARHRLLALALLAGAAACGPRPAEAQVEIVDVGRFNFTGGASDDPRRVAEELSGLAHMGGERFVAVSDEHATLYFLDIAIDPATGRVRSVTFAPPVPLVDDSGRPLPEPRMGSDREDVAYDPTSGNVWIADEWDAGDPSRPSLVQVDPQTGRTLSRVSMPADGPLSVYRHTRRNYGFEALARRARDGALWTGNEEALTIDGPLATTAAGSVVRLQELDDRARPVRQVAYVTDPEGRPIETPPQAVGEDRSGVSALIALDDGRLLVLERALVGDSSGMGSFRIRIYLADPSDATDVSAPPFRSGLAMRSDWVPATKALLWEGRFGLPVSNFEGMALGPRLADGSRSLLLVADNGAGTWQSIYALTLRGVP
ncbi:MAG TPA: esterase-like activity of phytase family protein [Gemmatimonadota bacterium]|nr:esterase-like activity of phytase family protein [Gemmatimonadota bacterium]